MDLLIVEQELYKSDVKKDPDRQVGHHNTGSEVMNCESLAVDDGHRYATVPRASGLYAVMSESTCSDKIIWLTVHIMNTGFCRINLLCRILLRVSCEFRRLCVLCVTQLQILRGRLVLSHVYSVGLMQLFSAFSDSR